jgi:uncharacterized repeat protein (TIGR03847 family)
MSESWDFAEPRLVVPGAIGTPGSRTFFVQTVADDRTISFKAEKQQVAALCEYLEGILTDLPAIHPGEFVAPDSAREPADLEWTVGRLAVAYEEADDRIVIVAEELIEIDEDLDIDIDFDDPDTLLAIGLEPASARFSLTRAQVAAFIAVGNDLVRSGRPTCRLCGRPMDPEGHPCPRLN